MIEAYNGTLFTLRKDYDDLFGNIPENDDMSNDKVFKIKYKLNILASFGNNMDLMDACGSTTELEIFETKTLRDLLDFKWDTYASRVHMIMFSFHCCYLVVFSMFVNEFYVYRTGYM
jgi:hypothetical protein